MCSRWTQDHAGKQVLEFTSVVQVPFWSWAGINLSQKQGVTKEKHIPLALSLANFQLLSLKPVLLQGLLAAGEERLKRSS